MLSRRFEQCLATLAMLLLEGSSPTGLLAIIINLARNNKSMSVIFFFFWYLKFDLDFKNYVTNWEKPFPFCDSCIWIGTVKLSLLRKGYLSMALNVLTSSQKIWHIKKREFFQLNYCLGSYQGIWQRLCDADYKSASAHSPCCLSKGPLNRDFLDIYLSTFSESVIL